MTSTAAVSFWKRFDELPEEVQRLAQKSYEIWLRDQSHPSLRFRPFKLGQWSVRIGAHYRAVGFWRNRQTFVWTWIGTHEEYNKL
jgi:hypothetical protein